MLQEPKHPEYACAEGSLSRPSSFWACLLRLFQFLPYKCEAGFSVFKGYNTCSVSYSPSLVSHEVKDIANIIVLLQSCLHAKCKEDR